MCELIAFVQSGKAKDLFKDLLCFDWSSSEVIYTCNFLRHERKKHWRVDLAKIQKFVRLEIIIKCLYAMKIRMTSRYR